MFSSILFFSALLAVAKAVTIPLSEQAGLENLVVQGLIASADCGDKAITCSFFHRWGTSHVTRIRTDTAYAGDMSDLDLGVFTKLRAVNLNPSAFTGVIPDIWASFDNLRSVNLGGSKKSPGGLSGSIPASLFSPSLVSLNLAFNSLSGDVPSSVENAYNMKKFILRGNDMTGGSLPASFNSLHNLVHLDLSGTGLAAGACPSSDLEFCNLSGSSCVASCYSETICLQDASSSVCAPAPSGPDGESRTDTCSNQVQDPDEEGIDCCNAFGGPDDANSCPCYNNLCVAGGEAEEEIPCEVDCSTIPLRDCEIGPVECVNGQCRVGYKPAWTECTDFPGASASRGVCDGEGLCVKPCDLDPCDSSQCAVTECNNVDLGGDAISYTCSDSADSGATCYVPGDLQNSPTGTCDDLVAGCCKGLNSALEDCNGGAVTEDFIGTCGEGFGSTCTFDDLVRTACPEGSTDCYCIFDASGESCFSNTCSNRQNFACSSPDADCANVQDGAACGRGESSLTESVSATLGDVGATCPYFHMASAATTSSVPTDHVINFVGKTFVGFNWFKLAWGYTFDNTGFPPSFTLNTGNLYCKTCNCQPDGFCGAEDLCPFILSGAQTVLKDVTGLEVSPCYALSFPYAKSTSVNVADYNGARENLLESHECLVRAALKDYEFFRFPDDQGTVDPAMRTGWANSRDATTEAIAAHEGLEGARLTSGHCSDALANNWNNIQGKQNPICGDSSRLLPWTSPGACTAAKSCQRGQCLASYFSEDASACDASNGAQQCTLGECGLLPVSGPTSCATMEQSCTDLSPKYCGQTCSVCTCVEVPGQLYCKLDASACDCQADEDKRDFPPEAWTTSMSKDDYFKVRLSYKGCADDYSAGEITDSLYFFSNAEPDQLAVTCTRCIQTKKGSDRTEIYVYVKSSESSSITKEDIIAAWQSTQAKEAILGLSVLSFSGSGVPTTTNDESLYLGLFVAFTAILAFVLVIAYRRKDKATTPARQFDELRPAELEMSA